jgi:hypothetical protein
MFRNLFRRGIPVLIFTLALAGAAPAAAQPSPLDRWEGLWGWVVSFWWDGETGEGDRGPGADPDGLTSGGDRGPELDPNGTDDDGDRGLELDPNG